MTNRLLTRIHGVLVGASKVAKVLRKSRQSFKLSSLSAVYTYLEKREDDIFIFARFQFQDQVDIICSTKSLGSIVQSALNYMDSYKINHRKSKTRSRSKK